MKALGYGILALAVLALLSGLPLFTLVSAPAVALLHLIR